MVVNFLNVIIGFNELYFGLKFVRELESDNYVFVLFVSFMLELDIMIVLKDYIYCFRFRFDKDYRRWRRSFKWSEKINKKLVD